MDVSSFCDALPRPFATRYLSLRALLEAIGTLDEARRGVHACGNALSTFVHDRHALPTTLNRGH